jgi:dihydropteroate synthase
MKKENLEKKVFELSKDIEVHKEVELALAAKNKKYVNKIKLLEKNGISKKRIIFDVGIGFGKSAEQNIKLIKKQ